MLPLTDWIPTLSLIFGGCCTNVITLEQLTAEHPNSGSLLTFLQFLVVSLYGLPKHITFTTPCWLPRLKPRKVHIAAYAAQVSLFYVVSLLNNAAFAYQIPMAVHIIFRSSGLVISMLLGWFFAGKRYNVTQILSVLLVTAGVIITTLSASKPSPSRSDKLPLRNHSPHSKTYVTGVSILTVALFLSGFLGILQDWTYSRYGRPSLSATSTSSSKHYNDPAKDPPPSWQESMFYLHFLALPMFLSIRHDLASQFRIINAGPTVTLSLISITSTRTSLFSFPQAYVPLLLNTLTQLLCVAGVHRLTTRVSALTVTLVLVVRKAASFVISVLWLQGAGKRVADEGEGVLTLRMIWFGAALVLVGTVGYSVGSDSKGVKNADSSLYSAERTDKGGKIE